MGRVTGTATRAFLFMYYSYYFFRLVGVVARLLEKITMRKIFIILCVVMCSVCVKGQKLGDYMEIDGVPGFVFYLDETGEHGLVMSFYATTEKQMEKLQKKVDKSSKKTGFSIPSTILYDTKLMIEKPEKDISFKEKKKVYEKLQKTLTDDGEDNAIAILEYCKNENLSLKDYFPGHYWASQLGEGWFVPGENEIMKFAGFITGGIGKGNKLKGIGAFQKRFRELTNDISVQSQLMMITFQCLLSSSMKDSKQGFLGLVRYQSAGLSSAEWFEYIDNAVVGKAAGGLAKIKQSAENLPDTKIVAVHKF